MAKGKKSTKEPKEKEPVLRPESPPVTEGTKSFYVKQIRDLEGKIERYQEKCDRMQLTAYEHETKYVQIGKDTKEIVSFLKKTLEQRQDEINNLQERLTAMQQAKDQEKEAFEQQMTQLKREFQEVRDQLTQENMLLNAKLSSLEEFREQREQMVKQIEDLEEQLKQQEIQQKEIIYEMERKAVVDKDRLKKEMILRVNEVAAEFRKVSNKQMAETTKRNIRENLSMNVQLGKMSEKTRNLIQENDALKETEKELRIQIKLLESCQKDLSKKNRGNLKVLSMVASKAQEQEMVLDEMSERERTFALVEEECNYFKEENKEMEEKLKKAEEELKNYKNNEKNLEKERDDAVAEKERIEDILAATAHTLREVISGKSSKKEDVLAQRGTMVERLLTVLDNAAIIGKGPTPSQFMNPDKKVLMAKPITKEKQDMSKSAGITTDHQHRPNLSHYKLGDLGLVPRPALDKSAPARASNVAHLSKTTRLGLKPPSTARIAELASLSLENRGGGVLPPISAPDTAV